MDTTHNLCLYGACSCSQHLIQPFNQTQLVTSKRCTWNYLFGGNHLWKICWISLSRSWVWGGDGLWLLHAPVCHGCCSLDHHRSAPLSVQVGSIESLSWPAVSCGLVHHVSTTLVVNVEPCLYPQVFNVTPSWFGSPISYLLPAVLLASELPWATGPLHTCPSLIPRLSSHVTMTSRRGRAWELGLLAPRSNYA